MKTYLLPLLAAFALTVGTAAAQTTTPATPDAASTQSRPYARSQGSPDDMAKRQSEHMTKELGLNDTQSTKVQQILVARGQEMQAIRGQGRDAGNRDQMREQMQANRAKYDAQFKEVLTAEQYTKYTTMMDDRMHRGGGPGLDGGKRKAKNGKAKMKRADK